MSLEKALLRARGTDHKANQEAFAQLNSAPTPQPVWLIKKGIADGYLDFKNVGSGKASRVTIDTNYPKNATLVNAHYDEAGPKFTDRFSIEPANMRDTANLEYKVSWVDESGKYQTTIKKAAER